MGRAYPSPPLRPDTQQAAVLLRQLTHMGEMTKAALLARIRFWLILFIVGLVLSGLTAFPLQWELVSLNHLFGVALVAPTGGEPALHTWLRRVMEGIVNTNRDYPFLAYGTDWLANKWVFTFGVLACVGVIPLALIAGQVRGIPFYWRLIDMSFGVFGALPLLLCLGYVRRMERMG